MITGLVFGTIFAITGRIWLLMVAHAAFDLTALAIIYWDRARVAHVIFNRDEETGQDYKISRIRVAAKSQSGRWTLSRSSWKASQFKSITQPKQTRVEFSRSVILIANLSGDRVHLPDCDFAHTNSDGPVILSRVRLRYLSRS